MMMSDCKSWSEMCAEVGETVVVTVGVKFCWQSQGGLAAFCGEDSEGECSGVMQMYFHFGFNGKFRACLLYDD